MPTTNRNANKLIERNRAIRRFDRGLFYIKLTDREDGYTQPIGVGIDPGSKKEGLSIKSEAHTYLNIQADAVTWVKKAVETRREMRRARRYRKTPYRQCRLNRNVNSIRLPPSTKARWDWKLRLCHWLASYFPIDTFVVEDVAARTKVGKHRWNKSFSPLEVGKAWFYENLSSIAEIKTKQGFETKELRDSFGLKKSSNKLSDKFEAHCIDSWVLVNSWVGGHIKPDNTQMLLITPLRFHRRQLHYLQPSKNGVRTYYGSTRSLGFKRGSWVKHPKYGVCYVGGTSKGRISLQSIQNRQILSRIAKPEDCQLLTYASWLIRKEGCRNSSVN